MDFVLQGLLNMLEEWGNIIKNVKCYSKTKDFCHLLQIKDGSAFDVLQIAKLRRHLQDHLNKTLLDLEQSGTELYMAVSVTNIHSKADGVEREG